MEKDKKENVKHFNLKWFNKKNIDLVDDKIEIYISNLLDIDEYIEINRKFQKITLELTSILNLEQRRLLREYQKVEMEITSYQNSLAYYLGLNENSKSKIK